MFNFFKKIWIRQAHHGGPEEISRVNPGFEETEQKTPKAGILLLIVMFVAGIFFGWRALDDLGNVPGVPAPLSDCSYRYLDGVTLSGALQTPYVPPPLYQDVGDSSRCNFNDLEEQSDIPALIKERQALEEQVLPIQTQFNTIDNNLREVRYQIQQLTGEYQAGLEEKQVKMPQPVFTPEATGQSLASLKVQEGKLLPQREALFKQINEFAPRFKELDDRITTAYKPVFEKQNSRLRWYEFQVFLLQFIFVLPFFWLALREYSRLHAKSSPYTIIAVGILAVAAILLLRVILFWFWDLFLAEVIRNIWRWIQQIQLLRSIIFYLGMVLSFAIFGGAVYWLQKRIFDPRRVMIRRFRSRQCPYCQTDMSLSEFYCPNCGHQLKEKCPNCGEPRFIGLPNCPHCGNKK